jgi:hypothetical protein
LYGLKAISAYNGWAMAVAGALIVLSGLAILSFIISQLHKVVAFLEYRKEKRKQRKELSISLRTEKKQEWVIPDQIPTDIGEAAGIYRPLIDQLEQPFRLSQLYEISRQNNLPHPHLTIRSFREAGILVNAGDGFFTWNQ